MRALGADADGVGLGVKATVADIYIVIARVEIYTGCAAQCDVIVAGVVLKERFNTIGRVGTAGCVAKERISTVGGVVEAGRAEE